MFAGLIGPGLVTALALLLIAVCSLQDATDDARTLGQMLTAARRRGLIRTSAALGWGALMVALLVACAMLMSITAHLAALGGVR